MSEQRHLIVVLGIQGSGKGTQAKLLTEKFGWPLAVAGDLFRARAKQDDDLGRGVKENLDTGQIMTIDQWEQVIGEYLATLPADQTVVCDGLLRSLEQLASFERIRTKLNLPQPLILILNLSREQAFERLMGRGRHDDDPDLVNRRIDWSLELMMPVVERYRSLGRVIDINGDQSIEAVHDEIVRKLTNAGVIANA